MHQRAKIWAATIAFLVLAMVVLTSWRQAVQAQTPNLSVAGAIYGGTTSINGTPGPVLPCYVTGGAACAGTAHEVVDTTTTTLKATCAINATCDIHNGVVALLYYTVTLSTPATFSNATFACSASIWSSSSAYVAYCQPSSSSTLRIYMYNSSGTSLSTLGTSLTISYTASGI
jgi:hypothetical protein